MIVSPVAARILMILPSNDIGIRDERPAQDLRQGRDRIDQVCKLQPWRGASAASARRPPFSMKASTSSRKARASFASRGMVSTGVQQMMRERGHDAIERARSVGVAWA
jgi:hypothetical protein